MFNKYSLIGLFLILFLSNQMFSGKIILENVTWIDNAITLNENGDVVDGGDFYISLSEFSLKGQLTENLFTKITINLAKSGTPYDTYFKTVLFKYTFIPEFEVTVGLQHSKFGFFKFWDFKLPLRYYGLGITAPPADLGIALGGSIADGLIVYNLQLLNGEGPKYWYQVDNLNFAFIADIRAQLGNYLGLGLSWKKADYDFPIDHALTLYTDLKLDNLWIVLDYFNTIVENVSISHYLSAFIQYSLTEKIELMARMDFELTDNSSHYIGTYWQFTEYTAFKPMIGIHLDDTISFEALAEFELRFGIPMEI